MIDPFTDATVELPEFHLFESASAIVDTLLDNIDGANAEEVAVVMDQGSAYPSLVESALLANDVPFHGGPGFADDVDVRTFLRLCRLGFSDAGLRLADVRPVLARCGTVPPIEDDEKRFQELSGEEYARLQEFCAGIDSTTFEEATGAYEEWSGQSLADFCDELDRLGVLDNFVSQPVLDDIEYYLHTFEVPVEQKQEGVLLASATSAAYVDRPVVFYLGMDDGWTRQVLDRPWIDRAEKDRRNLEQFELLVQNGVEQYYLVQNSEAGAPITPCLYFNDLLETEFEAFPDLPHTPTGRPFRATETGFAVEPPDVDATTVETISQSSLNTLVNCPRDYFFGRLVDDLDRDYFRKGNLFHDFAEFYVNHPGVVDETALDEIVDVILAEMAPFIDGHERGLVRTEIEVGLRNIVGYLSLNPPQQFSYREYEKGFGGNFFADHFDRSIDSTITEQWFENSTLGVKGKVDLLHSPTRLLDFKSGSRKSPGRIVRGGDPRAESDTPNFQALLYLAHHRQERPDERLEFAFFHFLENLDDVITGDADLTDTLSTVVYHPVTFSEFVAQEEAFETLCEGVSESNNCRKTLERMGYDEYRAFFATNAFPQIDDKGEIVDSDYGEQFVAHAKERVGDYKYVKRGCESALKQLVGLRQRKIYSDVHGRPHVYHNWRHNVISACLPTEYDEERRLLYVAMTRAKHHLLLSAGESPSGFFENLPIDAEEIEPDVTSVDHTQTTQSRLSVSLPTIDRPAGRSPHSLMDEGVYSEVTDGMGADFGTQVHEFAEAYATGEEVTPSNPDEEHVKDFIDSLSGTIRMEESAYLPLEVGERRVTVSGFIDLLHVTPTEVEIVDFKTDRGRHAESEYEKQLSVYYHMVDRWYPDRDVSASIVYTVDGTRVEIERLKIETLVSLLGEEL